MSYSDHEIEIDYHSIKDDFFMQKAKLLLQDNEETFIGTIRWYLDECEQISDNTVVRIPVCQYDENSDISGVRIKLVSQTENKLNFILESAVIKC